MSAASRLSVLALVLALAGCSRTSEPAHRSAAAAPDEAPDTPPAPAEPKPVDPTGDDPACLVRYSFDDNGSVLEEQRRRGGAARWNDFAERYEAAYIEPERDLPVEAVASFEIGETPLLWFRPDFRKAVVNAAVLGPIEVVNVTSLRVGQRETIGTLTELGQGKIDGRTLAHFLLRADALLSYVHIGSTVCLLDEREAEDGSYRGRYTGEHVYFTNEENVDSFGFEFELGADGTLSVTGIEAAPLPPAKPVLSAD